MPEANENVIKSSMADAVSHPVEKTKLFEPRKNTNADAEKAPKISSENAPEDVPPAENIPNVDDHIGDDESAGPIQHQEESKPEQSDEAPVCEQKEIAESAQSDEQPALPEAAEENDQDLNKLELLGPTPEQDPKAESAENTPIPQKKLSNDEVVGHTAGLWRYLPAPSDEPEPMPEYLTTNTTLPGSKIIAARVRGKKHKHEGTNCDDWYETANYGRITFIAVSDGAGSKKYSRIGARESCKAAIGYLVSSFEKLFSERPDLKTNIQLPLSDYKCMEACGVLAAEVQQAVIKAYEAVEAAFYSRRTNAEYEKELGRSLQLKDFSGTLLIAVIVPINEATKEQLIISCQIGDGMIAVINSNGDFSNSLKLLGVPDSGSFSGETDFLTSPQMKNIETLQPRTKLSRSVADTVMVMTDGVADDYFPNETQMRRLYFDLVVNGILDSERSTSFSSLNAAKMKLLRTLPSPLIYPWVNDRSVEVPIQYTNRIMEATGLTLEQLWNDREVLALASLELENVKQISDPSERLKIWLDNYIERGSFDDRTLVVAVL